ALTSVENNVLQVYNILQCSDVATSSILGDKTLYPGLLLANPRLTTGTGGATVDFLNRNNLKRVALVLEADDPSSETVQASIIKEGQAKNISFIVSLSITRPLNLQTASENPAVRYHIVSGLTNPPQYNQSDVQLLANLWANRNTTKYPNVLTSLLPSMENRVHCIRVLFYTFAEIIKRGLATPQEIASGRLLSKVPLRKFIEVANDLRIQGLVSPYIQFDMQTGMRLADTGIYNIQRIVNNTVQYDLIASWRNGTYTSIMAPLFSDGSSTPPRVMSADFEFQRDMKMMYALFAVTCVFMLISVLSLVFAIAYREHTVFTKSAIKFLLCMIVGSLLVQASNLIDPWANASNLRASCELRSWLFHIGSVAILGALTLKIYRIHRIFNFTNGMYQLRYLKDSSLFQIYGGIFLLFIVLLIIKSVTENPVERTVVVVDSITNIVWDTCAASNLEYAIFFSEILLLITGGYFAFKTREIREDYNEARSLGITTYNWLLIYSVAFIIEHTIEQNPNNKYLIHSVLIFLTTGTFLACIVGWKVYCILYSPPSQSSSSRGFMERPSTMGTAGNKSTGSTTGGTVAVGDHEMLQKKYETLVRKCEEQEATIKRYQEQFGDRAM
ncbi:hypothetical protein HK102_001384, partial [Quaeritorhiza haematococci]